MKDNMSMVVAALAIIISIAAIISAVVIKPEADIDGVTASDFEIIDDSVTGAKIEDGTITDEDISDAGISKISEVHLEDLGADVLEALANAGVITENSITSFFIANGTINSDDIGSNAVAGSEIVDGSVKPDDLAANSVTSVKILNGTILTVDLADDAITSDKILDGTISTNDIADNAILMEKIADGAITSYEIEDYTIIITYPIHSLSHTITTDNIEETHRGFKWKATGAASASLFIPKPFNWDGSSDIRLSIYFLSDDSTDGKVQFYTRAEGFDFGDEYEDEVGLQADPLRINSANTFYKQSIDIPWWKFGTDDFWRITLQRGGDLETYTDPVTVLSISLSFTATR